MKLSFETWLTLLALAAGFLVSVMTVGRWIGTNEMRIAACESRLDQEGHELDQDDHRLDVLEWWHAYYHGTEEKAGAVPH